MKNDMFLFERLRDYLLIYLPKQKVCSSKTIKSYREVLNLYLKYLCELRDVRLSKLMYEDISPETVSGFMQWLSDNRGCSDKTVNHHLSVLRAFLKYVGNRDAEYMPIYNRILQIPYRKVEKELVVKHFSEEVLQKLLAEPDPHKKSQHRDLFFMILLYDTGARDGEMLDLHPADVVADTKMPYVYIHGKGNKVRTVPIMKKTLDHYNSYIKRFQVDPKDSEGTLFYTVSHGERHRMSDDNVGRFIHKYAADARKKDPDVPENITPHMFRHSRAVNLYRNGMPLPLISELLGHSDLETTLIYAYADTEMKRKAISQAMKTNHPLYRTEVNARETDDDMLRRHYGLV